jgi:hypothetical protein
VYLNLQEYLAYLILFHFKLFDQFRIYKNLYKHILNLFENMYTPRLPHTTTLPGGRTLPHTLPDSRTQLRALPHTASCRTQHTALSRTPHTIAHRNLQEFK